MSAKIHNSAAAFGAKVTLRRSVLDAMGAADARVLDCYCGPVGEMYFAVWRDARTYVGIDQVWHPEDTRRRFVGDTAIVMRSINLGAFNVFDVDAFGSPFAALRVLAARRAWALGERGAVVLTDGATMKTKLGRCADVEALAGSPARRGQAAADMVHDAAIRNWLASQNLKVEKAWRAEGNPSARGAQKMIYSAIVFTKRGPVAPSP